MATIDRDPLICEERIKKRRELLIQLHEENKQLLANPALVETDEMQEKECSNDECLLNNKIIDIKQYKKNKILRIISIFGAIIILILALIIAFIIGNIR